MLALDVSITPKGGQIEAYLPNDKLLAMADPYPLKHFTNAREWHLWYVFHDKQFLADINPIESAYKATARNGGLDLALEQQMVALSYQYALYLDELYRYFLSLRLPHDITNKGKVRLMTASTVASFNDSLTDDEYAIVISPGALKRDVNAVFDMMKRVVELKTGKQPTTSPKAPLFPGLIFAVFRCLQIEKLGWESTFKLYEELKLDEFQQMAEHIETKSELNNYYNRYRPDRHLR